MLLAPGKMSARNRVNLRISAQVNFDKVLTLIALMSNSHSVSKLSSVLALILSSAINLPATDRTVLSALRPQS